MASATPPQASADSTTILPFWKAAANWVSEAAWAGPAQEGERGRREQSSTPCRPRLPALSQYGTHPPAPVNLRPFGESLLESTR